MIRDFVAADLDRVVEINAECVPEVGPGDRAHLAAILAEANVAKVVETDDGVVGFLLGLGPGAAYESPNYRWFAARHARFAYVDRIAITAAGRGLGLGPALYDVFEQAARDRGEDVLCAEVNVEPPNPRSLRFHEVFGFEVVAETEPKGTPDYRVAMVEKRLR